MPRRPGCGTTPAIGVAGRAGLRTDKAGTARRGSRWCAGVSWLLDCYAGSMQLWSEHSITNNPHVSTNITARKGCKRVRPPHESQCCCSPAGSPAMWCRLCPFSPEHCPRLRCVRRVSGARWGRQAEVSPSHPSTSSTRRRTRSDT
jgi:hypothetical protein